MVIGWLAVFADVPELSLGAELSFWAAVTGWELRPDDRPEFHRLARPPQMPLRVLLQRLGDADGGPARAHVDFACDDVEKERQRHEILGAVAVRAAEHWTTLRDPAGLEYCLTNRDPLAT
jgi:hypothetical protein